MDPDPFLRNTFWTVSIGTTFSWINSLGIHPGAVQRFVALPTHSKAKKALIYFVLGMAVVKILTGTIGMLVYTKYKDCDPIMAGVSVIYMYFICVEVIFFYRKKLEKKKTSKFLLIITIN